MFLPLKVGVKEWHTIHKKNTTRVGETVITSACGAEVERFDSFTRDIARLV